ncbi:RidA family protein [Arthrobacter bambusae]|uniref:RidA family protein n=1 Tax=Arthrobacter bambusae TaxID=1338426 RepID=UPI002789E458|nr:RidA family protein [Arthrobacter bambusae]MDQ0212520.1 enamine deaminase RidA (YjgF/YER057c/UK114 family) [Arthrobacter bambusae]MDQ0235954.1 enamine deaminase RidA (YjgF/YER057c/UK114 family) [Arthrobacter bambusae]
MNQRQNITSGSAREPILGYSRAVRVGNQIVVAGTTAGSSNGAVGGNDAAAQAREIFNRIETALIQAGGSFSDVIRTRVYLTNIADFDAVGAVHGQIFGDIRPVTAVVEVGALAADDLLVEIEADAILQ